MRVLVILLVAFFFAGASPLAAADTVRVRAAAHEPPGKDAYGRIVFEWPTPVPYKAAVEAGKLVVRFEQPFAGRLDIVTRYLGDYVTGASVSDEGRTVTFPLKAAYRLKAYADNATIVLDLIRGPISASASPAANVARPAAAAQPVSKPEPKSEPKPQTASATPPLLTVRVGDHEGFGRLVFDWTLNVEYSVQQDGSKTTIRFNQPARLDYTALTDKLPKTVKAAEPLAGDSGVAMTLTLADNARVRHFRSGTRVVVDVLEPSAAKPAVRTASAPTVPPPPPAATAPSQPVATNTPAKPQQARPAAGAPPANLLARQSSGPAPADSGATESLDSVLAGIPGMAPSRAPMTAAPRATAKTAAPATQKPLPPSAAKDTKQAAPAAVPAKPAAPTASAPAIKQPAREKSVASVPAEERQPAAAANQRVVIHPLGTVNDLTGLRLSSPTDAALVAYERSGYLWLMFDRRLPVELTGAWPHTAVKPQMVATSVDGVTLLRWVAPAGKHPGLRRDGNDWVIDVLTAPSKPLADIKPEAHVAIAGPKLLFRGSNFLPLRGLRDPEVGDQLWIVPMTIAGRGSATERRLVDLQVFATLQGLVIKPLTDELVARNTPEGVELTMPGGLYLTGNAAVANNATGGPSGQTPIPALATRSGRMFDFDAWRAGRSKTFFDRKRELLQAVIEAPKTSRNAARLALAQFFFAHGYASDALGILQVIEQDDATAIKDPAFRSLRGASRYLAGDYAGAGPDLFDSSLDTQRELALWRGALLASQNDWLAASRYFAQGDIILHNYPMDLRLRFGLLAAESALTIGDIGLAKYNLDTLAKLKPSRPWRDQIDYLQGRVLAKSNDPTGAAVAWERAMAGVHRPSRVKSLFARAEMLLANKKMTPAEAITEIEKLRYAWRGDEIELAVLKRLGELYIDVADYRNGLQTLREAMINFPKSQETRIIDAKMRAAFAALYIGNEADKLPPLSALALYDDFHELSPTGEAGDVVASKLVDRLVGVELLDRAANILKQQIDTRLKGAAAADAVNRLGLIYLLDRRPEEALSVLNGRMPPDATPTTVAQRRQIKARTLGELTRYKDALDLLEGDDSRDADRLRAEIGWRTQNWQLAAYAFGRLVPEANKTMTDADRQTVLRLAIAQSLNKNGAALKDLRKLYGAGMEQSAFKESFNLVTAPGEGPAVDLRAITKQVAEVDQFRAFLSSYRDKLLPKRTPADKEAGVSPQQSGAQTAAAN